MNDHKIESKPLKLNKKSIGRIGRGDDSASMMATVATPMSYFGLSYCCCTK